MINSAESDIQRTIEEILSWHNIPYLHIEYQRTTPCSRCGHVEPRINNRDNAGVPDLVFPAFGVEIKTQKGKISRAQKLLHEQWDRNGVPVYTGYGRDECLRLLQKHFEKLRGVR